MARKRSSIPGLSFSWKRALGVTRAKQRLARKTGIPLTRSGMYRKIGRSVSRGGCLIYVILILGLLTIFVIK